VRLRGWLFVAFAAIAGARAGAQTYGPAPVPQSTSSAVMHDAAVQREIVERFHLGMRALDERRWPDAIAEFTRIEALRPREPQGSTAAYDLGIAQAQSGAYADAAQSFERAIARDPGFLAAMANLVAVDVNLRDLRAARAAADRFVAAAPDSARALYARGLVALQDGDLATARGDFSKLLQNDPQYAVAHYDLGVVEVRAGRYDDAQREFTAALQVAPGYARARFALATVLLHDGDRTGARSSFDRAAADAADDPTLRGLAIEMRDAIGAP
jgi:tetratricopeptide (TPR) repeat protein